MRAPAFFLFLFALVSATACAFEPPLVEPEVSTQDPMIEAVDEVPPSPMGRLGRGLSLALDSKTSEVEIGVARSNETANRVRIRPLGGRIALRLRENEQISSSGIDVEADDVIVSPEVFPPRGLHLTDLHGSLKFTELKATWVDRNTSLFAARGRVEIRWSLIRDEEVLPIRPLIIEDTAIEGDLVVEGNAIVVSIRGSAPGQLLDVVGAQLGDLDIDLRFAEARLR